MGGSSNTNTTQNSSTQFASQGLSNFLSQMSNASSSTNAQKGTTTQSSGPTEAAKTLIEQASQPISADQIAKYQNPYQEQVVNATMAQLNNQYGQQQNTLRGNAISQGALGGDRAKVAQAALMGQQGLNTASTIGSLQSQNYTQALSAAQAQQARELQAAGMMGTTSTGTSDVLGSSTGTSTGQQWGTNTTNTSGWSNSQQQGQSETSNNPGISGWLGLLADGGAVRGYDDGGAVMGVPEWARVQPIQFPSGGAQQQPTKKGKGLMSNVQTMMKQFNPSGAGAAAEGAAAAGAGAAEGAGAAAGGVGEGLGALFALFSDERMKENKREVGRLFDGQKVYAYNYTGHPQTQLGLMAQEVERKHPEAVGESGGALTVRYDTATRDAAKRGHFADGGEPDYGYSQSMYNQGTYQLGQQARTGLGKLFDQGAGLSPYPQQPVQKPSSLDTIADAMRGNGAGGHFAYGGRAFGGRNYDDDDADDFYAQPVAPVEVPDVHTPMFGRGTLESPIFGAPNTVIGNIVGASAKAPPSQPVVPAEAFAAPQSGLTGLQPGVATRSPSPQLQPGLAYQPGKQTPPEAPVAPVKTFQVDDAGQPLRSARPHGSIPTPPMAEPGGEQVAPAPVQGGLAHVVDRLRPNHMRTVANVLRDSGASDSAVRGILANVQDESGGDPGLRHPDQPNFGGEAHYAHGLYQYGGEEWKQFDGWMRANHPDSDWRDPTLQTQFMVQNLKENYPQVWKQMNEGTPEQAAQAYLNGYLKPAERHRIARMEKYGNGVLGLDDYLNTTAGSGQGKSTARPEPTRTGLLASLFGGNQGQPAGAAPPPLFDPRGGSLGALLRGEGSPVAAPGEQRGGVLQRLFGLNINPLGLTDNERAALIAGGFGGANGAQIGASVHQGLRGQDIQAQTHGVELALKAQQVAQGLAEPKIMSQTMDAFGAVHPQYGVYNPTTGQYEPIGGASSGTVGAGANASTAYQKTIDAIQSGATGLEFLKAADPQVSSYAKNLTEYKVAPPTGKQAETPQAKMMLAAAQAVDPSYDPSQYKPRQALKTSFTNGRDAEEIKSYNMVMDHIASADARVDTLGNTRSSMVNGVYNAVRGQTSPEFIRNRAKMDTDLDLAIKEANKATAGKAITAGEEKSWHEKLSSDTSPEAMHATLQDFLEKIHGRMGAVAEKWNSGMGLQEGHPQYKTAEGLLSSSALKNYNKVMGRESATPATSATPVMQRPLGLSNVQLRQMAEKAIANGKDKAAVMKQLADWGAIQ